MRNWLFPILLAVIAITLVCCNQKEELPITQENLATETLPEALQHTDGVLYGEINEEGEIVVDLTVSEDYDGAASEGREYCVYNLRTLVGNPYDNPCPLWHAIGFDICVNCPDHRPCPGITGKKTRFRFLENGVATCVGDWILKSKTCIDCPPDGKTGYRFVN
ncbi:MAG: hypothetical protein AAGG75_19400 [Bacteroidota bacterium]